MKRLKNFWRENSVLCVLFLILLACFIAICVVVLLYFVGDSSSKYGDRLEGIDKISFKEEDTKDIISKLESDEQIKDVSIRTSGKTIYVVVNFDSKITLVEAESKALASLELFSEEVKGFYDIEYMIKSEDTETTEGFQIIGSHNVSGTGGLVWNNNTAFESDEEE